MTAGNDSPDHILKEFVCRANARDVDGPVALYTSDATLPLQPSVAAQGHDQIRAAIETMLANRSEFSADGQRVTIVAGDIARISSATGGERYTAEVAVKQPNSTWLWIIDHADFISPDYVEKR